MSARINRRAVLGAAAALPVAALPSASLAADRSAWDAAVAQFRVVQKRCDEAGDKLACVKGAYEAAKKPYPETLPADDYPDFGSVLASLLDDKTRIPREQFTFWAKVGSRDDLQSYQREARRGLAVFRRIDRDNARLERSIGVGAAFDATRKADYAEVEYIDEVLLPCPVPDLKTLVEKAELLKRHADEEGLVDAIIVDLKRLAGQETADA